VLRIRGETQRMWFNVRLRRAAHAGVWAKAGSELGITEHNSWIETGLEIGEYGSIEPLPVDSLSIT